jgi:hypothetical protein
VRKEERKKKTCGKQIYLEEGATSDDLTWLDASCQREGGADKKREKSVCSPAEVAGLCYETCEAMAGEAAADQWMELTLPSERVAEYICEMAGRRCEGFREACRTLVFIQRYKRMPLVLAGYLFLLRYLMSV